MISDRHVSLHPYFKVHNGKLPEFKEFCSRFIAATSQETKCLYYGFTFNGHDVHCREAYEGAEGLLAHLDNVGAILGEALQYAEITRLEVHAAEDELAKLRQPLAALNATFFALEFELGR